MAMPANFSGTGNLYTPSWILPGIRYNIKTLSNNAYAEYSGVISGGGGGTFGTLVFADNSLFSNPTLYLSNTANTWTGCGPSIDSASPVSTYGITTLRYNTIANGGVASSCGAGTSFLVGIADAARFQCVGAGGSSDRSIEDSTANDVHIFSNTGTGPVKFLGTSLLYNPPVYPVLEGSNTDLNEFNQYMAMSYPLAKQGTGRWVLSGEKRYKELASYSTKGQYWLTSGNYNRATAYFIEIFEGFLRLNSSTNLKVNGTDATYQRAYIKTYSGGTLELDNYNVPYSVQVAGIATYYPVFIDAVGVGQSFLGSIRNIAGANTVYSYLALGSSYVRTEAGSSLTLDSTNWSYAIVSDDLYITGEGTLRNYRNLSWSTRARILKYDSGTYEILNASSNNSAVEIHGGRILTSVGGENGVFSNGPLTINSGSYLEVNSDSPFGWVTANNTKTVTVNSGSYIQVNSKAIQNGGGSGHSHVFNNASVRGTGDYYHENNSSVQSTGQSYTETNITYSMVNANTNFTISSGKLDIRGRIIPDIGGRTPLAGITKLGNGKLQLSSNTSTYAGPTIIQAGTIVATATNSFGSGSVTVSGSVNALSGTLINFKNGVTTAASSSFIYGAEINQDYMTVTGTLSAPTTTNVAFNTATPGTAYALYQFGAFDRAQVSNIVVSYNNNDVGMIPKTFVLGNRVITKPYGSEAQVVTNLSIPVPSTITLGNNYKYRGTYGLIKYTNFTTSQLSNLTVTPPSGYNVSPPFISGSAIYVTIS